MFTKVLVALMVFGAITALPQGDHYHSHGHASSLQNIVLDHEHGHEAHYTPVQQHDQYDGHSEHNEHHVDYYAHPKYEYAYEIKDPHTHDFKSQHEHRDGDSVKGEYSLHQPDGTVRVVKYYADKKTGFHADVKYVGHATHVVPEHHQHH